MTAALLEGLAACGISSSDRLLVAVSGGLDSTVLLRLLVETGHPVVAAHVDHGLQPESVTDGAFVASLAADLGVSCVRLSVAVGEGNVQAEARRARYAALADAARAHDCAAVATAHTATDQAETVLMALARGAGLRGLAGMPWRRSLAEGVALVRPLLHSSREQISALAQAEGWGWREDPSNATGRYRRNRLRHNVLPVLRVEHGPGVDLRMAEAAAAARAALGLVTAHLGVAPGRLPLDALRALDASGKRLLLAEAVAQWAPSVYRTRALLGRLVSLVDAEVGSAVESGGLKAWRERDAIRLGPSQSEDAEGWLEATLLPAVPRAFESDPFTEVVDADRVEGEVLVRPWRAGDRIRPLGMDGSQLVSDLLQARGVPRADRPGTPVVEVDGRVLWVVGHRLAADAALTESTRRAARWSWHRSERAG